MTFHDDELDEFLRKRRPLFRRDEDLEPPIELDRVVLRQAREAIEAERPHRVFRAPSWGMPVALAATLVLAFTIILRVGTPEAVKKPQVTVQHVSRQIEIPAAASAPPPAAEMAREPAPTAAAPEADGGAVVVDIGAEREDAEASTALVAEQRARRLEKLADTARAPRSSASDEEMARYSQPMGAASRNTAGELRAEPAAAAAPKPEYRRDAKTWLAEIERLRAAGDTARADAELAEYKREHRAYAVAPDR